MGLKIAMAATEQGKPVDIVCSLEHFKAFEGEAKVILHGLPAKVTADAHEKMIKKGDKEVVFRLTTDPKTPKGQHKSLFCQIIVPENGESIVHNTGRGVLRVDPPPPAPKKPKVQSKKPVVKKKPEPQKAVKRLTRLEKLRLEAEKRAKEEANQQQK